MFGFFEKKAVIIRTDEVTKKVDVQEDIPSIPQANRLLSGHLANVGAITLDKSYNEHDGIETLVVEKTKKRGVWHETQYFVLPAATLNDGAADGSIPE